LAQKSCYCSTTVQLASMKEKILISACLIGERVRYDGRSKALLDDHLSTWKKEGRLVPICPEVLGGLPVPREPAEQVGTLILSQSGKDVTQAFEKGAALCLEVVRKNNIKVAILKERSPSCASKQVYDGTFSGHLVDGKGRTTLVLEEEGVRVFGESEIQEAWAYICTIDAKG